jgi:hypothetical protein
LLKGKSDWALVALALSPRSQVKWCADVFIVGLASL